jgi:hypothetical protein
MAVLNRSTFPRSCDLGVESFNDPAIRRVACWIVEQSWVPVAVTRVGLFNDPAIRRPSDLCVSDCSTILQSDDPGVGLLNDLAT